MLRYAQNLWDAFFPTEPIYPTQIVGEPDSQIRNKDELEYALRREYVLFTYHDKFERINTEYYPVDTDQGWGCLVRSTQMLLAHFLLRFGKAGDYKPSYFFDRDHQSAPFSLHNMVKSVWREKTFRPEYWSPSQGCEAIRRTVSFATANKLLESQISVIVSNNGSVSNEDIVNVFKENKQDQLVLILTPVRVSASSQLTQESYLEIEKLLTRRECAGMVGGTPGRSYFFFAHNQTQLLYLDPHQRTERALLHTDTKTAAQLTPTLHDVHCVHWSRVDTSFFLAFAVKSEHDWVSLRASMPTKFLCIESRKCNICCPNTNTSYRPATESNAEFTKKLEEITFIDEFEDDETIYSKQVDDVSEAWNNEESHKLMRNLNEKDKAELCKKFMEPESNLCKEDELNCAQIYTPNNDCESSQFTYFMTKSPTNESVLSSSSSSSSSSSESSLKSQSSSSSSSFSSHPEIMSSELTESFSTLASSRLSLPTSSSTLPHSEHIKEQKVTCDVPSTT